MLGPPKPRRLDEPIAVSLEDLVPTDNFYRHLEATLDLSFVRQESRDLYAERVHGPTTPVLISGQPAVPNESVMGTDPGGTPLPGVAREPFSGRGSAPHQLSAGAARRAMRALSA